MLQGVQGVLEVVDLRVVGNSLQVVEEAVLRVVQDAYGDEDEVYMAHDLAICRKNIPLLFLLKFIHSVNKILCCMHAILTFMMYMYI